MVVSCSNCGQTMNRTPSQVRERNYCSRACHYGSGAERPNRKLGTTKKCEVCSTEFYAPRARPDARFCSVACKGVASRSSFNCEVCGAESFGYRNRNKRWCSRTCAAQARETGEQRTCERCEKAFYADSTRIALGQARYCSTACANEWQGRNKISYTCKICAAEFHWSPSREKTQSPKYCSLACRNADPDVLAMLLKMNTMQQLRRTTKAEVDGYALLDSLGVQYERQAPFNGKFTPDATIPDARLVVQFDGDYWHDRKGTSTEKRIRHRVALDRAQDAYMRACGWEVVRLWESDLKKDPEGCAEKIRQHLFPPS